MQLKEKSGHISHLFLIACIAENQILSSAHSCKTVVTHDEQHLSTLHDNQEQQIVETTADFPLSPSDFLVDLCDKEELCDNSSLILSPQLEIEHSPVSLVVLNLLQEDGNNSIGCIEQFEQLQPLLKCKKNDCAAPTKSEEGKQSNTLDAEHNACEYVSNTL